MSLYRFPTKTVASIVLVSCLLFVVFFVRSHPKFGLYAKSQANYMEIKMHDVVGKLKQKLYRPNEEVIPRSRQEQPLAACTSPLSESIRTNASITVNVASACKNNYKGPTSNFSAVSTTHLLLQQYTVLTLQDADNSSKPLLVNGALDVDTTSKVHVAINTKGGFDVTYGPWSILLLQATTCPSVVFTTTFTGCPARFACALKIANSTSGCTLTLVLTPTDVKVSLSYYTLQLNLDCATYTPSWFKDRVSTYYSKTVAAAFVLDPMFCGSVYQSFRCSSYTQALAETACNTFFTDATTYNSTAWYLLNVNWGWKLREAYRPTQSHYELHALFVLFVAPVGAVIAYGCWKEGKKRKQQELGAYSEDEEDFSANVARPAGK